MGFKSKHIETPTFESPEMLFHDLRNRKIEGLLSHQADMLRKYTKLIDQPDIALELPTGSGKTLIGLIIGEYRRRVFRERVVYLCPNNQLVNQVVDEARSKFGINCIAFTGPKDQYTPSNKASYNDAEAIAVTNYSSIFNTNPFFNNPDLIILDDAHASENYISNHWSLNISRTEHSILYNQILDLFKNSIPNEQYYRMKLEAASSIDKAWIEKVPTPYLVDLHESLIVLLDEQVKGKSELYFNWTVLREKILSCQIYISWNEILIRPIIPASFTLEAFTNAKQRLFMSATLGKGGDLERITGRRSITRIAAPEGWDQHGIGRRFFIFPENSLNSDQVKSLSLQLIEMSSRSVVLVQSDYEAEIWKDIIEKNTKTQIFKANDIEKSKSDFISQSNAVAILANRYDGLNLYGDECRLEIMSGLPSASNLQEKFISTRMAANVLLRDRVKTRIVQALGRCTRSATDYSLVCIIGEELKDKLLQRENLEQFHPELQAELEFGREESKGSTIENFIENYQLFLDQKQEWKDAEQQILSRRNVSQSANSSTLITLESTVKDEIIYLEAMWSGNFELALEKANTVSSKLSGDLLKGYRGFWYYLAGSAAYILSKDNNDFTAIAKSKFDQASNCTSSVTWLHQLAKQNNALQYTEKTLDTNLLTIIERLEKQIQSLGISSDNKFEGKVKQILEGLYSNNDSTLFEQAHLELGKLLGYESFNSQENGAPDPWWIVDNSSCICFEDYTETKSDAKIPTYKVRQVISHPTWIKSNTPQFNEKTEFVRVIISPATKLDTSAIDLVTDIYYWNQTDFANWASNALNTIRSLRVTFFEVGNDNWRKSAYEKYIESGLDPIGLKKAIRNIELKSLWNEEQ